AEDWGPLTLCVRERPGGNWPHFARPALGASRPPTAADVAQVRARQRELGVPERFEWVAETTPGLRAAAREAGLGVLEYPLMTLDTAEGPAADPRTVIPQLPDGVRIRVLEAGDPALPGALAVPRLVFTAPAPGAPRADRAELAVEAGRLRADGTVAHMEQRMRAGLVRIAVAVAEDGTPVCAGQHQPAGTATEIVGVGTLPSARRRGIGLALTAALVADARAHGVRTVVLSAADDDVARLYARLGFRHAGTVVIGEPEPGEPTG
ncbi:GNAT family N-acetyltransferase, partial [Streptomyces clavuligerus]|uniref:GNAT family N-acetyltransferase n=1 Tax=Streptomyces clavuligerus TaxID=1901 RepID=UPI0018D18968